MLTSRRIRFWRFIGPLVIMFVAVCHPSHLDAKAWLNGHIMEMKPDGFLLQMRFYRIAVHTAVDTQVRCKKQSLSLTDLEVQDLVTIEGSKNHDGSIVATKVTIHRDWLRCREIEGSRLCHCKC
jgi:Domain of unknown function (DUF5666)